SSSRAMASTTGATRSSSSVGETARAPGRVDSPPTSIRVAPAATIAAAWRKAASMPSCRPPSEKESGVTLRMPMTCGRDKSRTRLPQGSRVGCIVSVISFSLGLVFACRTTNWRLRQITFRLHGHSRRTGTTLPVTTLTWHAAVHDVVNLLGIDGFILHQRFGHEVELVTVVRKNLLSRAVAVIDDAAHLKVDQLRRVTGNVRVLTTCAAPEEDFTLLLRVHQWAELLGQPPLGTRVPAALGRTQEAVGCTGSDATEAQRHPFSDTPAERGADLTDQRALGQAVTIFFGQEHGYAQRPATRNDGDLVNRIMLRHQATDDGVARFVISLIQALLLRHDHGLALGAHHDLVLGQLELLHLDHALSGTSREERRLVDQVGQVGTGEARGASRDQRRLDAITQRNLAHMDVEDLFTAANIRQTNHHLTVEPAWTQQRRVKHVGTVGSGNHDDAVVHFETVHLHQQLVEGLFTLIMTTAKPGAAMATDGIDLVNENDAGRMLLGLLEHVAHAARTHTHKHLDEVGTGNGEERHLGLTRNGLGQQCLTGTRGT